jgi:hypothetical protein
MIDTITKKEEVDGMKAQLEKQKKSDSGSLDKLSAGKKTMKTMFKG